MPFVNLFLDDELHAALKERAKQSGMPLYKLIPYLLTEIAYDGVVPAVLVVGTTDSEELPVPAKTSLDLVAKDHSDWEIRGIDFGLGFKPVPKPANGRKRAKTREKSADMSDNVE